MELTKENLEQVCIEENGIYYNPGIAYVLAGIFDLDMRRIRLGWMERDAIHLKSVQSKTP